MVYQIQLISIKGEKFPTHTTQIFNLFNLPNSFFNTSIFIADAGDIDQLVDKQLINNSNGTFSCGICGTIKATTRQNMRSHIETHLSLRFTCDVCNKEYSTRNSLRVHKSSLHKNVKDNRNIVY